MSLLTTQRAAMFRQRAAESESRASAAQSEDMRRAWLIVARDWRRMAERDELRYLDGEVAKLAPDHPENT